jgi:hypothetical protein
MSPVFAFCSPFDKRKAANLRRTNLPIVINVKQTGKRYLRKADYDEVSVILPIGEDPMSNLMHWLGVNGNMLAILITVGVAVLLACCLECSNCGCREKDDLFKRHGV